VNLSGEQNPLAPKITANVSVDYLFRVGNGTIDPRVTFAHTDQQYDSIFEAPFNLLSSRDLWSASLDWTVGKWDTQLFGTNLTDQTYIIGNGNGNVVYYGSPRQVGAQATYHF
jgi:iron complex outermembrane receptor protein